MHRMPFPRLRRFVLDLAVRGKLVEQDPEDEPPPRLDPTIPHDLEPPFPVPPNWRWSRLRALGMLKGGGTPSKAREDFWNGSIPWVSPKDMKVDYIAETQLNITETSIASSAVNLIEAESILFVVRGMILAHSFPVAISRVPLTINQDVKAITLKKPEMAEYLLRALKGLKLQVLKRVKRSSHGTCRIESRDYRDFMIPLPPLAEQRRIVAKVDELMALCDRLEEARVAREDARDRLTNASYARLRVSNTDDVTFRSHARFVVDALPALAARAHQVKRLRQTILDLAVRGKLVEQDPANEPASELLKRIAGEKLRLKVRHHVKPLSTDEIPFSLPVGWLWSRIGELCTKTGSGSTPRGGKNVYKKVGVPFLRSQNVYNDGLRLDDVAYIEPDVHARMAGTAVRSRDILLNITGGSMGRCCFVPDEFSEANVSQHVSIIRPAVSEMADFLQQLVLSPYFQAFIFDEQTGAGRGGLPKYKMDRIVVAVPPLAEQRRIVAKVDELMTLCDRLEASLDTVDTGRHYLLESLLREALVLRQLCIDG